MKKVNFNREESLAIFRVLEGVAKSDDFLQTEEMDYLVRIANDFKWNDEDILLSKRLKLNDAVPMLRNMSNEKKLIVKDMLIHIADSDGVINSLEFAAILDTFFVAK